MRKINLFLLLAVVAVSTVFFGCGDDDGGGGTTFTASTKEITNDVATLGLVGTSVSSSKTNVATATIDSGKVKITSVNEGTATIAVSDGTNTATIAVVVSASGAISETITKYTVGGGGGGDAAKFQGTWIATEGYPQKLVFTGSSIDVSDGQATGTFAVNETTKTLTITSSALTSDNVFTYSFSNSDTRLTLSGGHTQLNGTYAK